MGRKKQRNIDKTLKDLSLKNEAPKSAFVVLMLLYFIATIFTIVSSRGQNTIEVFGMPVAQSQFTGVFSAISNICIICLVMIYRKLGFFTSLTCLLIQFPLMYINVFVRRNPVSIPGFVINVFTIITIIIIFVNNQKILKYQKRFRDVAIKDRLTKLPNRFACGELMEELVKHTDKFAVVSIDLNDFKSINDTMGHDTGDKVLLEVAKRGRKLADSWKTGTNDFVSRLTGDEFMVIVRGYEGSEQLENTIKAYRTELEKKITIDDCDYYLTACYGYTEFPEDARNIDTLFVYADAALHESKRIRGTNEILKFTPDLMNTEKSLEIERKIRAALDKDKIFFHLQPQYDMDHKLRGFEALARMKDSDGSFISPVDFIPVAEKIGVIDKIDLRVFDKAAGFMEKALKKDGSIILSVNTSVKHLMKNNYVDELKNIIDKHGIPADRVEIEITESIMIDSAETALQRIDEVKDMGMKVAIDDFGTGYSSLSYLNSFPSDMLKIDKSFIDKMDENESSRQYVGTIISIGHILGLHVLAEGVESLEQVDTLKAIDCDYIQGYVWGRPVPPEEAFKLVNQ